MEASPFSVASVKTRVEQLILATSILGARKSPGEWTKHTILGLEPKVHALKIRYERDPAVFANLNISLAPTPNRPGLRYHLKTEITWDGERPIKRTPATALAAISLYIEVVNLAAAINSMFDGEITP